MHESCKKYSALLDTLVSIRDDMMEDLTFISPDDPGHEWAVQKVDTMNWAIQGMVELMGKINSGPGAYYDPRSKHYREYNGD